MTEPRIHYAKSSDGVNIAYWTLGEGKPLVYMPSLPWTHIEAEWRAPDIRSWYERIAKKRMLIRYDSRGSGLSDRDVGDLSLDAHLQDLAAVVNRLRLETMTLLAGGHGGPVAITYASRHPERVSNLILWCTYASVPNHTALPGVRAVQELRRSNWEYYTEQAGFAYTGLSGGEPARQLAAFFREAVEQDMAQVIFEAAEAFDTTEALREIQSPTLVLHRNWLQGYEVGFARTLVSRIPDARLVSLEGVSPVPFIDDPDSVLAAIDEFLGEGEEGISSAKQPAGEDIHTILFTDVEGSTALTDRLGDEKAREVLREHERIVRGALKSHGGSEVKTLGDGFMTSFSSATKALGCAIAIQRAFVAHNKKAEEPILVRIGLNAGEPIAEDNPDGRGDLFGASVNRAARIAAMAQGGEILVANVVRELAEGKEFMFGDRGETALRGFDDPVRLFEVQWHE